MGVNYKPINPGLILSWKVFYVTFFMTFFDGFTLIGGEVSVSNIPVIVTECSGHYIQLSGKFTWVSVILQEIK